MGTRPGSIRTPGSIVDSRRRSQRVVLQVPITVSVEGLQDGFSEATSTLVINAHGALILLKAKVKLNQMLLISTQASEKMTCRVASFGATLEGRTEVGIEFSAPVPHFWHITFPPDDWVRPPDLAELEKKK